MPEDLFPTLDDYERYLRTTLQAWSHDQRTLLAAAMAERWLPAYLSFSQAENWGDPAGLRYSLDMVWSHLGERPIAADELARLTTLVEVATPHMDDFDANEALSACVMVIDALRCCLNANNLDEAVDALLSGFEAIAPDILLEPPSQQRLWRRSATRKERQKQQTLLKLISPLRQVDYPSIQGLRSRLASPELTGEVQPREKPPVVIGISNRVAFEQYRRMVESDLKQAGTWQANPLEDPALLAVNIFARWSGRYRRRRDTIDGTYGKLVDETAVQALLARNRAKDARPVALPAWDPSVRSMMDLCMANTLNRIDASTIDQPHSYGPSLRQLWSEAKALGESDWAAWLSIIAWAHHKPLAWDEKEQRRIKRQMQSAVAPDRYHERELVWSPTDDLGYPWEAEINGARWRIGLNDFPDDYMYCLEINQQPAGRFHDWPESWRR